MAADRDDGIWHNLSIKDIYEIATYGCLIKIAQTLGLGNVAYIFMKKAKDGFPLV